MPVQQTSTARQAQLHPPPMSVLHKPTAVRPRPTVGRHSQQRESPSYARGSEACQPARDPGTECAMRYRDTGAKGACRASNQPVMSPLRSGEENSGELRELSVGGLVGRTHKCSRFVKRYSVRFNPPPPLRPTCASYLCQPPRPLTRPQLQHGLL